MGNFLDSIFYEIPPLKTVDYVSLDKYCSHQWYEIQKYPFWAEDGLRDVTASYSKMPDGRIQVVNQGIKSDGTIKLSTGYATVDDNSFSKLHVTFFWPFAGEYWIIKLDKDYNYSVVSDSKREYLWILSSTPKMDPNTLVNIRHWLTRNFFNVNKLEITEQSAK